MVRWLILLLDIWGFFKNIVEVFLYPEKLFQEIKENKYTERQLV